MGDHYLLATLAAHWRKRGVRVSVGADYSADCDLCILHHDISRLDENDAPRAPEGTRVVNGEVFDISKRTYSTLALEAGDEWPGPVIIKSNLNHYGAPEAKLIRRAVIDRVRQKLADVSWRGARMLPTRTYPVLLSIEDVPDWVWTSPDLLVEKFLPERTSTGHYAVRGWVFCGDRGYAYRVISREPIVKPRTAVRIRYLQSPPAELVRRRAELKFDYGKFDYVEHEDGPILLDANKTPVFRGDPEAQRMRLLSMGIESFF